MRRELVWVKLVWWRQRDELDAKSWAVGSRCAHSWSGVASGLVQGTPHHRTHTATALEPRDAGEAGDTQAEK